MALINCYECNKQISSIATACPHCGAPIAGSAGAGTPLATTQLTSKRLKIQIVFSSLALWIGAFWLFVCYNGMRPKNELEISCMLIAFGFLWYIATKVRIWWHHK